MRREILAAAIGIAVASTALAQTTLNRSQEEEAVGLITGVGGTCGRIVASQVIGELDDRSVLMAVACDGGEQERYVMQLDRRANMSFLATCENLAKGTNNQTRCFASNAQGALETGPGRSSRSGRNRR
jgi:hypothetical protein